MENAGTGSGYRVAGSRCGVAGSGYRVAGHVNARLLVSACTFT